MPGIAIVGTWSGSGSQSVDQLTDLDICMTADGPVIYGTSRTGQSITTFDLGTGSAVITDQRGLPGSSGVPGDLQLEVIELDNALHAVSLSAASAGLPCYALSATGDLADSADFLTASGLASRGQRPAGGQFRR